MSHLGKIEKYIERAEQLRELAKKSKSASVEYECVMRSPSMIKLLRILFELAKDAQYSLEDIDGVLLDQWKALEALSVEIGEFGE